MAQVEFKNVWKIYDKEVEAVKDFNLDIADREFVVFVGPSGCGKSTTLRMIAGLEEISSGEIYIGGELVNNIPPKDRDISMVFQNYALYPHMTVYDNIGFPLRMRKMPKSEIDARVRQAADILDITELLKRKPKALSGGQRQRVAIGRAIVREPRVFLMDEPLSNLDAKLRNQMRTEIIKLRNRINTTFVYVTHDQTEAMTLGDRIVIMDEGIVRQVGSPREVFDKPQNLFVAGFIGTPQMNFLEAELKLESGKYALFVDGNEVGMNQEKQELLRKNGAEAGKVIMGVRPEHFHVSASGIPASADVVERTGSTMNLHAIVGGTEIIAVVPSEIQDRGDIPPGSVIHLTAEELKIHLFNAETGVSLLYLPK